MFTGIIEALGRVTSVTPEVLVVEPVRVMGSDPIQLGESVAVNGCCLTVVDFAQGLRFDVSPETLARTSLGELGIGSTVNLERAMRADGRFGGHVVQGHVDATAEIVSIQPVENSVVFRFRVPLGFERYLIDKGSVALDGISLTVVKPEGQEFEVWVIPHTLTETNLGQHLPGDCVNLEVDMLAKYVERLLPALRS